MKSTCTQKSVNHLGKKQEEVVVYKCLGLSNKDIARVMFISEGTVHAHLSNVYQIHDLHSEIELLHWYMETHKMVNLKNLLVS